MKRLLIRHTILNLVLWLLVQPANVVFAGFFRGDIINKLNLKEKIIIHGYAETYWVFRHTPKRLVPFREGFDVIQARNQLQVEILAKLLPKSEQGKLNKLDLYLEYRGWYDGAYAINHHWGESNHVFGWDESLQHRKERENRIREAYADIGYGDWQFRLGKQQIVWGNTDFFRLADIINPLDYSWHYFLESFEDIRTPTWMSYAIWSLGKKGPFSDLNIEFVINPGDFESTELGYWGQPWSIAPPGFKAIPESKPHGPEGGIRVETLLGEWLFQISHYYHHVDDPVFNIIDSQLKYPHVQTTGFTYSYYDSFTKCVFRGEFNYNWKKPTGDTRHVNGIKRQGEFKCVLAFDRDTWIRWLNRYKVWSLSSQLFMTYLTDWHKRQTNDGLATKDTEVIFTLMASTTYKNGRMIPTLAYGFDWRGDAHMLLSSVEYLLSNHLSFKLGTNLFFGRDTTFAGFGVVRDYDEIYLRIRIRW